MHAYIGFTLLWVCIAMVGADVEDLSLMTAANDQLSAKMLSAVARQHSEKKSVVLSAFSVLTPLSLLSLAAEGQTHTELLSTLGFENDDSLIKANTLSSAQLSNASGIQIKMANRIYIPNDAQLNSDFAKKSMTGFGTEVKNIDFSKGAQAVADINKWVAEQTNNKIMDLVDQSDINAYTQVVLVNALYFVGKWIKPFTSTFNGTFYKSETSSIEVPLMFREGYFGYYSSDELDAKLLQINYFGSDASFVIILPNIVNGLASLLDNIEDPSKLRQAIKDISPKTVRVTIPKFKIETETNLKEILQKIGVNALFKSAELPKLFKGSKSISVSNAVQKAFISVDENGTEAAAANKVVLLGAGMPAPDVETFTADHPFVFLIKKRDLILFSGVYNA